MNCYNYVASIRLRLFFGEIE